MAYKNLHSTTVHAVMFPVFFPFLFPSMYAQHKRLKRSPDGWSDFDGLWLKRRGLAEARAF
jgi:hypothetical protein